MLKNSVTYSKEDLSIVEVTPVPTPSPFCLTYWSTISQLTISKPNRVWVTQPLPTSLCSSQHNQEKLFCIVTNQNYNVNREEDERKKILVHEKTRQNFSNCYKHAILYYRLHMYVIPHFKVPIISSVRLVKMSH